MFKKAISSCLLLLLICASCYAASLTLSWEYDTSIEENKDIKFRIYTKEVGTAEYPETSIWDSKDDPQPTEVRQATVTVVDGKEYNFIARAYRVGMDENEQPIEVESENSNEVVFDAPIFAMTGVALDSFTNSEIYTGTIYFGSTGEDIKISWSSLSGVDEYTFRLYDINRKYYSLQGNTTVPNATFKMPKTGTYEFEVRARRGSEYTAWQKFDGRLSGWIAPVGPIVIE